MGESSLLNGTTFPTFFLWGWEFLLIFWYQQVTKTCKLIFVFRGELRKVKLRWIFLAPEIPVIL